MRRRLLALVCAGLVAATLTAQTPPPQQPTGTAIIAGQVIDAVSRRGIPDVSVTALLARNVPPDGVFGGSHAILTDGEGRFVLKGLPAGTYQVGARRAGYVDGRHGVAVPGGEGKPIPLEDGGRFVGATIPLSKLAALGGTVIDDAGEPVIGVQVQAFKRVLSAGRWRMGEYYSAIKYRSRTDDRGAYRISDLLPGEYIVVIPITTAIAPASLVAEVDALRTNPASRAAYTALIDALSAAGVPTSAPGSANSVVVGEFLQGLVAPGLAPSDGPGGSRLMYRTQFFPGMTTAGRAQGITVAAGDERAGIDFALKPERTWKVAGTLTGPAGPAAGMPVRLVHDDGDTVYQETEVAATITDAGGRFTLLGVPAGQYVLRVLRIPRPESVTTQVGSVMRIERGAASPEPTLWASAPVAVGDADVSDVAVALNTGVRARGRVIFESAGQGPTPAQRAFVSVTVELADGRRQTRAGNEGVPLSGDAFTTGELAPGKYVLRVGAGTPWKVKSIVAGERDISDAPLVVEGREIPPITVTLSDRPGASIGGTVRASGNAAAEATVFLFPAERESWLDYGSSPRRLRRVRVNAAAAYNVADVPPGNYLAAALAEDRAAYWRDPTFLASLTRVAARVTVAADEAKVLDLRVERSPGGGDDRAAAADTERLVDETAGVSAAEVHMAGPFARDEHAQLPARDAARGTAPVPTGTAAIAGTVVSDDANARPVRRVVVTLNCPEPRVGRTTVTDDAGRFAFGALPACSYTLAATKPGYIPLRYGATRPGRPGTPMVLAADARSTVNMKIMRGAVITGVVRDARGEPIRGVSVGASQHDLVNGERQLTSRGRSQEGTDDRGQYRIFGLEPGEYLVSADRPTVGVYRSLKQTTAEDLAEVQRDARSGAARGAGPTAESAAGSRPDTGYAAVYHPGTPLLSHAHAVTVAAGEERAGVDIALQLVPLARIRAKVTGPDGLPPAMVQARLAAITPMPGLGIGMLDAGLIVPITDGNAVIQGVPPGEYALHVGGSSTPPPPGPRGGGFAISGSAALGLPMWAIVPVTIDGRDVDLAVALEPARTVKGRVIFEGATPPPQTPPQVALQGPQLRGARLSSRLTPATPEFTIEGLVPAGYRMVAGPLRGWMVKSAILNGRDAADLPVEITSDVTDAVVTLTDKITELSGVLQSSAGTPAPNYFVIVFPKDPAYWLSGSRRIVSVRPNSDGRFVTTATAPLPPGDYHIAAVTDVETGEWFDPAFLKTLVASAVPVTIGEGEKKRQDLQIR